MSFQDLLRRRTPDVEVRDPFNDIVKERRSLVYGEDYDIDYIQGRVILFEPLPSTVDDGFLVPTAPAHPATRSTCLRIRIHALGADFSDLFYGGRASAWLGKYFNLGATAIRDQRGLIDKQLARS